MRHARWGRWLGLVVLTSSVQALAAGVDSAPSLETPRSTLQLFVEAGREGDFARAARALDLSQTKQADREAVGAREARRLKTVLDQTLWIAWEKVSDDPDGDPADGPGVDVIGEVPLGTTKVPIALTRLEGEQGARVWKFSAETVARIPTLHDAWGSGWLGDRLPEPLFRLRVLEVGLWQWLGMLLALLAAYPLGRGLTWLGLGVADRIARRTSATWDERLVECLRAPVRAFLGVLVFGWLVGPLRLALPVQRVTDLGCRTALILAAAWAGLRLVDFVAKTVEEGLGASGGEQGGRARGVRTAVVVLRRVAQLVVGLGAAALVLTQFEVVRNLGVSLLASAGLAGIVVGLAAQKSITSLLAGLQLSITQPVRLGDTVIVEGEWGTIEEINLTYVVVRVWDLRRLVVPVSRFLDQPFQNWTKVSTEIMGTVEIVADYKAPIDAVRAELQRLCKASARWDAKVCGLQVTAMSERTMTLRALVSSADAGKNWELRCEVREGLIKFLQGLEGGRFLPRTRVGDEGALGPAEEAARNVVAASS